MDDLYRRQSLHIDALLANFERELNSVLYSALARTQARLQAGLSITDGRIDRTAKNSRFMRRVDSILIEEMDRSGYGLLVDELVAQFPGQLPFFNEIVARLSESMRKPLTVQFGKQDIAVFQAQGELAADGLAAVIEAAAARTKQRIMMSVGGLQFKDLVTTLADSFGRSIPEAVGLAETAQATYYRVIADRGYRIIEADNPGLKVRYKYEGPKDKLTRPFCRKIVNKSFTRAQIDRMDNGQLDNVFLTAGGYRCRHNFVISL